MILVNAEEIPFTTLANVLVVVERELLLIVVALLVTPLTLEVIVLALDERVLEFTKFVLVVEITPLTFDVNTKLLVVVAILMRLAMVVVGTEVVEVKPLIVAVSI